MEVSTPLLSSAAKPAPGDHVVEFDRKNGIRYRVAVVTIIWAVLFSIIVGHVYAAVERNHISNSAFLVVTFLLLGLLRVLRRWQRKEFDAQKCTISDRRVVVRTGWLNRSTKTIPLDRIQDVIVRESWLQRFFKVKSIVIQTAGTGCPRRSMTILRAPANAPAVRDTIMERRDLLVIGLGGLGDQKAMGGAQLSSQVNELKDTMVRIEGLLETGLQCVISK